MKEGRKEGREEGRELERKRKKEERKGEVGRREGEKTKCRKTLSTCSPKSHIGSHPGTQPHSPDNLQPPARAGSVRRCPEWSYIQQLETMTGGAGAGKGKEQRNTNWAKTTFFFLFQAACELMSREHKRYLKDIFLLLMKESGSHHRRKKRKSAEGAANS